MKKFKHYIIESTLGPLTHVMTYDPVGNHYLEHLYHAPIPTQNGTSNLWITHMEQPAGKSKKAHGFNFSISKNTTPEVFERGKQELILKHEKEKPQLTPFGNIIRPEITPFTVMNHIRENNIDMNDDRLGDYYSATYHGPLTMLHVMRHMQNIVEKIPSGHMLSVSPVGDTVTDRVKKAKAYTAIMNNWKKIGLVKPIRRRSDDIFFNLDISAKKI